MLRIRLIRIGKKNASAFRLVLTERTSPPKGKFLEVLGNYNPRLKQINLKKEKILYWISKGAQASDTVHNLLVSQGVIKGPKIKRKMKVKKKEEESKEVKKEETSDKKTEEKDVKKEETKEKKPEKKEEKVSKKEAKPVEEKKD